MQRAVNESEDCYFCKNACKIKRRPCSKNTVLVVAGVHSYPCLDRQEFASESAFGEPMQGKIPR